MLPVVDTEADKPTITAMTTSTGEPRNELWWAWYAAIYHWVAFASLWLAILWSHEPKVNLAWWPFSIMGAVGGFVSVGVSESSGSLERARALARRQMQRRASLENRHRD